MKATENDSLNHWVPGSRFFSGDDGKHFVVDADTADYGAAQVVRRTTAVLYCTADGLVEDLTPDHVYPPGTTAEQVLAALGYELGS